MKDKVLNMDGELEEVSATQSLMDELDEFESMKTNPDNPYNTDDEMQDRWLTDIGFTVQTIYSKD